VILLANASGRNRLAPENDAISRVRPALHDAIVEGLGATSDT
jgi:hypothetical protein